MKLNRFEKALVNNPVRRLLQRRYEAPLLESLGGRLDGGDALEIGCGPGVGTQIILERFGVRRVRAFDLDPEMVALARRRLRRYPGERLAVSVGDATAIDAPDAAFDAVFDFGVIHHVPDWQLAVAEVTRVLKPGGRFFFEEATRQCLDRWAARMLTDHPRENRFSGEEFVGELERQGIAVGGNYERRLFGDVVIGVGRRVDSARPLGARSGVDLDKALRLAAEFEDAELARKLQHRK